jgi:DnaJ domain
LAPTRSRPISAPTRRGAARYGRWARRNGGPYVHIVDPFDLADDAGLGERSQPRYDGSEQLTPAERSALGVLELSWPLTRADVKSRYKELVKLHHPDANGGAREAEEKLKQINAAYSTLRASEHLPAA